MSDSLSQDNLVKTIRLSDDAVTELLDRLDQSERETSNRRQHERYTYRLKRCVMHMQQPGSAASTGYFVATRNLSAGGVSVFHGGFVHRDTRCVVQLISTHGAWTTVVGKVLHCRYVEKNVHELSITFDNLLDPANYCPEAVKTRVLLADDDPSITRLTKLHLSQLNAQVDVADNGQIAVSMAQKSVYDVVLMDMEMPVMDGFEATKTLRSAGYTGMIVAATGRTQPEDREKCLQVGCTRYMSKPYSREDLEKLIKSLRQEPLFSSMQNEVEMTEIIHEFVTELPSKIRALEEVMAAGDAHKLETLVRMLKGEAGGYGFEPITEAAVALESALLKKISLAELRDPLDDLLNWCMLARSTATPTETPE